MHSCSKKLYQPLHILRRPAEGFPCNEYSRDSHSMKTHSGRYVLFKIYILTSMFVRSVWKSVGFCTKPRCIYESNLVKICRKHSWVMHDLPSIQTDKQTDTHTNEHQTNILAKMQILTSNNMFSNNRSTHHAHISQVQCDQVFLEDGFQQPELFYI